MDKLSIIVPVYYNAPTLPALYEEFRHVMRILDTADAEFIFVDDGSGDHSAEIIAGFAKKDSRVKLVQLSKNHGSGIAVFAGLSYATGDCAVIISADLQDPPSLIHELYRGWKEGFPAVLAVRSSRKDPWATKVLASLFYRLMRRFGVKNIPEGGCDYGLIDRKVIDAILKMEEKNSHLIIQVLWTGYERKLIAYERRARAAGRSRWSVAKKIKLFIDSFTAFSYFPLRVVSSMGFTIAAFGLLYALFIIGLRLVHGVAIEGWSSLMVVVLIASGAQLIGIGIIGEYLWRVLDEVRKRPIFLVKQTLGFDDDDTGAVYDVSSCRVHSL
ncbi:MAG: glycosyltransferase family 2 protein [Acidobacteriota bacterium]